MYARLRPIRSPSLLPTRMNAAETSASSAIADWTPLAVVSRSWTTAEIETFISEVSTTSTNIAIASSTATRRSPLDSSGTAVAASTLMRLAAEQPVEALAPGEGGPALQRVLAFLLLPYPRLVAARAGSVFRLPVD